MSPGIPVLVALAAWGALCSANQRAIGGLQLHQPIVAAVGAGLLLGDPGRGLLVGLWLQLVWFAPLPVGGVLLPDSGAAAVSGAALAILLPGGGGYALALLLALGIARLSIPSERFLRERNGERQAAALAAGDRAGLAGAIGIGIAGPAARGVAAVALTIAVAAGLAAAGVADGSTVWALPGGSERAWIGGAGAVGLAGLLLRFRSEAGRGAGALVAAGILFGLIARFLTIGGRP